MEGTISKSRLARVGLFPLPNVTFFPHQLLPLNVFEPRYRRLTADAIEHQRLIGVPRLKPGFEPNYYGTPEVVPVFGVGEVIFHHQRTDGTYILVLRGVARVRLLEERPHEPFRVDQVEQVHDVETTSNLAALRDEVQRVGKQLLAKEPVPSGALIETAMSAAPSQGNSEFVMADLVRDPTERQALLEERDPAERLTRLLADLQQMGGAEDLNSAERAHKAWN